MLESTKVEPKCVHFGGENIFRAFIAALQQSLLNKGFSDTGLLLPRHMMKR